MAIIWAADQQPEKGPEDDELLALARRNRPQCSWWWGRGRRSPRAAITCYVCGEVITPAAPAHVLPRGAIEAVMEHRALELERNGIQPVNP